MIKLKVLHNLKKAREFVLIFYLVGIIGFAIPFSRPVFQAITPLTLILVFTLLLFYQENIWKAKHILLFIFIYAASFFIEVYGVNTGKLFGEYIYGKTLGFKFFNTPVIIGLNWILLLYAAWRRQCFSGDP